MMLGCSDDDEPGLQFPDEAHHISSTNAMLQSLALHFLLQCWVSIRDGSTSQLLHSLHPFVAAVPLLHSLQFVAGASLLASVTPATSALPTNRTQLFSGGPLLQLLLALPPVPPEDVLADDDLSAK